MRDQLSGMISSISPKLRCGEFLESIEKHRKVSSVPQQATRFAGAQNSLPGFHRENALKHPDLTSVFFHTGEWSGRPISRPIRADDADDSGDVLCGGGGQRAGAAAAGRAGEYDGAEYEQRAAGASLVGCRYRASWHCASLPGVGGFRRSPICPWLSALLRLSAGLYVCVSVGGRAGGSC